MQPTNKRPIRAFRQAVPEGPRLFAFQILNTASFQLALGPPMILMVLRWGASSFYVGALMALVPLLTTLQLAVAPWVEYIGFRRVMLSGWTARNSVLLLIAVLPFLSDQLGHRACLAILFGLVFLFNTLRGLATASWMPWLSRLVPPDWRGRYFSVEQLIVNLSSAGALFVSGWLLGEMPSDLHFGWLYLVAVAMGWGSLFFLRHVESPPPLSGRPVLESLRTWTGRVWEDRSFRRVVRLAVAYALTLAGWGAFTILFLRNDMKMSEAEILFLAGLSTVGGVASSLVWGILADRFGSRPIMELATRLTLLTLVGWILLALNVLPEERWVVAVLYVLIGVGSVGFAVANNRYVLNYAPRNSAVLALTFFSVVGGLSNAAAPLLWGLLLDAIGDRRFTFGSLTVGRFVWFYALTLGMLAVAKAMIRRLPDAKAAEPRLVLYHLVYDYPLRTVSQLYRGLVDTFRNDPEPPGGEA